MNKLTVVAVATLAVVGAGCGKPNPGNSCRRQVDVACKRAFECNRAQAETLYGDQSSCVRSSEGFCTSLDNYECDDLSTYERCISDYERLSCAAISGFSCPNSSFSTCRMKGTSGRTSCQNTNVNTQSSACTLTLTNCTDGRSYVLSCSGSSCTCNDGSSTRNVTSSCSTKSAASAACGWNVD